MREGGKAAAPALYIAKTLNQASGIHLLLHMRKADFELQLL